MKKLVLLSTLLVSGLVAVVLSALQPPVSAQRAHDGSSPDVTLTAKQNVGAEIDSYPVSTVAASLINPETDLEYLGAFKLPDEESNDTSWSYGGHGMTYFSQGDPSGPADGYPGSLFSISHPYQNYVSEFSIPVPAILADKNVDNLPVAETLQPFVDVTAGRQTGGLTGTTLGDIQYYPRQGEQTTDKLHWVMYEYYLPDQDE